MFFSKLDYNQFTEYIKNINRVEGDVLLVDKPYHVTSFEVVNKVKIAIKKTFPDKIKVGHAGTLDPLATGLLIICTGKKTKQIEQIQALEKEYTGTFFVGATTPCFDKEKEIDFTFATEHINEELIIQAAKKFVGKQMQTPPIYSAVHIDGKRAYDLAREGVAEIKINPKEVDIKIFEITRIALPEIDFRVVCSKGTYIRSLARDFGLALNSGAYLTALRRTRIGGFEAKNALTAIVN
ncbi:MAG TPA: tRNA pseudouridine(55) synthase TruB [Bacteroidia bacterium]|jgi:tRNA pseudouridine55 synthase|nr:tRNA pseudouridine(55) synthase TruB [Bacteroidia bacterium]